MNRLSLAGLTISRVSLADSKKRITNNRATQRLRLMKEILQ